MLSLISLGRAAWAKLEAVHPAIRWGGAILVGLAALDFFGNEAVDLYIKIQTAPAVIQQKNAEAARADYEAQVKKLTTRVDTLRELTPEQMKAKVCSTDKNLDFYKLFHRDYGC